MRKTILETVVGSTVHGTSVDDGLEDLDLMAVVLESQREFIGFRHAIGANGVPVLGYHPKKAWVQRTKHDGVRSEAGDVDHVAYGLKYYISLAVKSNPSALLVLFAPPEATRQITPEGESLQAMAPLLVSRHAYNAFQGFMRQQYERLTGTRGQRNVTRPELVEKYGFDTKYAGHIIRLGLQGREILETGRISLPMPLAGRELVLAVRTGKYKFEEITDLFIQAEKDLLTAYNNTNLPTRPDYKLLDDWMISVYEKHWYLERNQV